MQLRTYVGRKVTAKSRRPAVKGDAGKTEIHSEKNVLCLPGPKLLGEGA